MSLEYYIGVLDSSAPSICSLALGSDTEHVPHLIKQDVLSVVKFIDNERQLFKKVGVTALKLLKSMNDTSMSSLIATKHRLQEVHVILAIQDIKRNSLKYSEKSRRNGTSHNK